MLVLPLEKYVIIVPSLELTLRSKSKIFGYVTFISVVPALKGSNGTHMGSALNSCSGNAPIL